MTLEETRSLASLTTVAGYQLILDLVVKSRREDALQKLKLAHTQEEITSAALDFRAWDEVFRVLETTPQTALDELKSEGDSIYG